MNKALIIAFGILLGVAPVKADNVETHVFDDLNGNLTSDVAESRTSVTDPNAPQGEDPDGDGVSDITLPPTPDDGSEG